MSAHAQDAVQTEDPAGDTTPRGFFAGEYEPASPVVFDVETEPFVWYVSPGGHVGFGGAAPLSATKDLSIDEPRIGGGAELHLVKEKWRLSILGSAMSLTNDTTIGSALTLGTLSAASGDRLRTEFEMSVASIRAGYRFWEFAADADEHGVPMLSSSLELVGGVRAYDFGLSSEIIAGSPPGRVSGDMLHVEPIVGAKFRIDFQDRYSIDLATNIGLLREIGSQSSSSFDITVGLKYRPTPTIGAQIGYRLLVFDLESEDVEAEGALAGLYGGIAIRF